MFVKAAHNHMSSDNNAHLRSSSSMEKSRQFPLNYLRRAPVDSQSRAACLTGETSHVRHFSAAARPPPPRAPPLPRTTNGSDESHRPQIARHLRRAAFSSSFIRALSPAPRSLHNKNLGPELQHRDATPPAMVASRWPFRGRAVLVSRPRRAEC